MSSNPTLSKNLQLKSKTHHFVAGLAFYCTDRPICVHYWSDGSAGGGQSAAINLDCEATGDVHVAVLNHWLRSRKVSACRRPPLILTTNFFSLPKTILLWHVTLFCRGSTRSSEGSSVRSAYPGLLRDPTLSMTWWPKPIASSWTHPFVVSSPIGGRPPITSPASYTTPSERSADSVGLSARTS
jgi:hypothetical protein